MKKDKKKQPRDKPVSLEPLEFEEAVADLLKVKPNKDTVSEEEALDKQASEPSESG